MCAAIETLRELPCAGRRVAVLGDMAELGADADRAHAELGRTSAEMGVDHLVAVGKRAAIVADAARAADLQSAIAFANLDEAARAVRALVGPGDMVLLKGSRAAGLERLGADLRPSHRNR